MRFSTLIKTRFIKKPPPLPKKPAPQTPASTETSFLSEESVSPLRNKLPTIAPLPSRQSVDNFSRPITEITDGRNNAIY